MLYSNVGNPKKQWLGLDHIISYIMKTHYSTVLEESWEKYNTL